METQLATMIQLDQIEVSTTNEMFRSKAQISDEALQELAASIRERGVLQPVSVRPHPKIEGKFQLIFGERRHRASILAGMSEIPATIAEVDDEIALEIQIIENLERVDVHPVNEAKGYKFMLERNSNLTTADLAARFRKSETYILQRLKLNDLVREAKRDFLEDKMLFGHAILLARLTPQDQRETREQITRRRNGYGTVGELETFIEHNIMNSLSAAAFDKKDEMLYRKAGACLTCPKRSGASPMLFADIKEKDKCFDRSCFFTKCQKHLLNKAKEIVETQPDVFLLKDYNEPAEEVTTLLLEQQIKPLSEYGDFSQHKTGGARVKGLWISGGKAGHLVTVFLKKEEKSIEKNDKKNAQEQVDKIKQRMARGRELDREKVYAKILEAIHQHPSQKKGFNRRMTASEDVMLWFIIFDKAGYHIKDEVRKIVGLTKDDPEKLYDQIKKMSNENKAFLLRKVLLDQYGGNYPASNYGHIVYRIASEYKDINIAGYEKEQKEICDKRETRARERIKQLLSAKAK